MTRSLRKRLTPSRVKIGVSGRFSPIYGSVEWKSKRRSRRRRK